MAIKLFTRYPGRADPASSDYPQGSFKNRSAPGALDGTPLEKDWANDIAAFLQSLMKVAGLTPNDTVDKVGSSQYFDALKSVSTIPIWSPLVDYTNSSAVFGSDGKLYTWIISSGPNNGGAKDPISEPTYWKNVLNNKSGQVFQWPGSSAPPGAMALPLVPTNVSRATYSAIFAAIGTQWGIGDGSTTFGFPYCRSNYAIVAANGNVGSETVGDVIAHTHSQDPLTAKALAGPYNLGTGGTTWNYGGTTGSTGGSANLAAGVRMLECIWL